MGEPILMMVAVTPASARLIACASAFSVFAAGVMVNVDSVYASA